MFTDAILYITGGSDIGIFIFYAGILCCAVIVFEFLSKPIDKE